MINKEANRKCTMVVLLLHYVLFFKSNHTFKSWTYTEKLMTNVFKNICIWKRIFLKNYFEYLVFHQKLSVYLEWWVSNHLKIHFLSHIHQICYHSSFVNALKNGETSIMHCDNYVNNWIPSNDKDSWNNFKHFLERMFVVEFPAFGMNIAKAKMIFKGPDKQ